MTTRNIASYSILLLLTVAGLVVHTSCTVPEKVSRESDAFEGSRRALLGPFFVFGPGEHGYPVGEVERILIDADGIGHCVTSGNEEVWTIEPCHVGDLVLTRLDGDASAAAVALKHYAFNVEYAPHVDKKTYLMTDSSSGLECLRIPAELLDHSGKSIWDGEVELRARKHREFLGTCEF